RWSALPERMAGRSELRSVEANLVVNSRRQGYSRSLGTIGYSWPDDFPLSKQEQAVGASAVTTIRLRFHLDDDEVKAFKSVVGVASNNGELPLEIKLGQRMVSLKILKQGRGAKTHQAKSREIAEFIAS